MHFAHVPLPNLKSPAVMLLAFSCVLATAVEYYDPSDECTPFEAELSQPRVPVTECALPRNPGYSFSSVPVPNPGDSLLSTRYWTDGNGELIGSFELEHRLSSLDKLVILMRETTSSSRHSPCRRIIVCNMSLDGWRHRLRLNVKLQSTARYTMKIIKLTNSSEQCETQQVRFFDTGHEDGKAPLVQIAVRSCDTASSNGRDYRCRMDAYLQHNTTDAQMKVSGTHGTASILNFGADTRSGWRRQQFNITLPGQCNYISVQTKITSPLTTREYSDGPEFFKISTGSSLPEQLHRHLQTSDRCQAAAAAAATTTGHPPEDGQIPVRSFLLLAVAAILLAAAIAAIALFCRCPQSPQILLVFPESPANLRANTKVKAFCQELRAAAGTVKQCHVTFRELNGLRALTAQLARTSQLIVILSADSAFSCYGVVDNRELSALITEKWRTWLFFVGSGGPPDAGSVWAQLHPRRLEDRAAKALTKAWDIRGQSGVDFV